MQDLSDRSDLFGARINPVRSCFWLLVALSSAGFDYEFFTFFKVLLLGLSFLVMTRRVMSAGGRFWKESGGVVGLGLYFLSLFLFARDWDYWTTRVLFNVFVLWVAALAANEVGVKKSDLWLICSVAVAAFSYRLNRFFGGDGKPLVHDQVLLVCGVLLWLATLVRARLRFALYCMVALVALAGNVRAALFALGYCILFQRVRSIFFHLLLMLSITLLSIFYIDSLLDLGSAGSLSWRVVHWLELLGEYSGEEYLFGRGLGAVWRDSLNLSNFYTDGESYVDAHSYYVQLVGDVGFAGLLLFFIFLWYLGRGRDRSFYVLVTFFLAYGVFQGGVWQFSLIWILLLSPKLRLG